MTNALISIPADRGQEIGTELSHTRVVFVSVARDAPNFNPKTASSQTQTHGYGWFQTNDNDI